MKTAILAAGAALLVSGAAHADEPDGPKVHVGDRAPDLDHWTDSDFKPVHLADYRGKWLVVLTTFSSCDEICWEPLKLWNHVAPAEKWATFVVVDITGSSDVPANKPRSIYPGLHLDHMRMTYWEGDEGDDDAVVRRYEHGTVPGVFVIDPKGIVRYAKAPFDMKHPAEDIEAVEAAHASAH